MDSSTSPPKIRLNHTPLRRMNTVGGSLARSEKKRHSSVAALYTPQDHKHQPLSQQQQPQSGYRKLSIGSKTSPKSLHSHDRVKKRISGINFNIPVVATDNEDLIRSSSTSPQQQVLSPNLLERPSSIESMPSPSPKGHMKTRSELTGMTPLVSNESDLLMPITPTPVQKREFETPLDDLSTQLRELAAKELELLEIKETIKNLVNKKRTMEIEFELLKKTVERSLHRQINPTTTTRKSHSIISSPRGIRSPTKQHHRSVSDHPLDDNFNSVTPSHSSISHHHHDDDKKSNRRQTGLWGIITQVDNYIQNEFEKFNIIDLNPNNNNNNNSNNKLSESYYQIPDNKDIPSEDNKIKKLLDSNGQHSMLPQSLRNVVDAVIYGSIDEEDEQQPHVSRQDSKKSVEMKDFSHQKLKKQESWDNDFGFDEE